MAKPALIFFGMPWCPHCRRFEEGGWKEMEKDVQLKNAVSLRKIDWNTRQGHPIRPLPEEYKFVNYGPYFWLEAGRDANGKPVGLTFPTSERATYENVKKWVASTLNSPAWKELRTKTMAIKTATQPQVRTASPQEKAAPSRPVPAEVPKKVQVPIRSSSLKAPAPSNDEKLKAMIARKAEEKEASGKEEKPKDQASEGFYYVGNVTTYARTVQL
jgi:hypothetical protein